jgi:complex iron-sulfur molybdoenzyme family reductase subunit gamma
MRKQLLTIGLSFAVASFVHAASIAPALVSGDLKTIGLDASQWQQAQAADVILYPQLTTVSLDEAGKKAMNDGEPLTMTVRALANDSHLALHLSWADETASAAGAQASNRYSDAFAVQFPQSAGDKLPYIGMGNSGNPALIHLKRYGKGVAQPMPSNCREEAGALVCSRHGAGEQAGSEASVQMTQDEANLNLYGEELAKYKKMQRARMDASYQRTFVAEGFGTTTELRKHNGAFFSSMRHEDGRWSAVLVRSLSDEVIDLKRAVVPMALAVWDGDRAGRDGIKWLSGWTPVVLGEATQAKKLMAALTEEPSGDAANGEQLALANCASCHRFDQHEAAMEMMAPNLTWVGGQATAAYIRESILNPHAVVVTGYNRYAHRATPWYNEVEGELRSTMPAFNFLPESDIEDMVAYFKSLK